MNLHHNTNDEEANYPKVSRYKVIIPYQLFESRQQYLRYVLFHMLILMCPVLIAFVVVYLYCFFKYQKV